MTAPTDVRLSEAELAALRRAMSVHSGREQRRHVRHQLPDGFALVVRAQPRTGPGQTFSASGRDISASGMGFYHNAYVHPDTPCTILMRTLKNDAVAIKGTAARCRHVSGRIHEVGVVFENEIEVGQFVQGSTVPVDGAEAFTGDVHARIAQLVLELKAMVDQRTARATLLGKVGELAMLLSPEHTPAPKPDAAPATPAVKAA
jgi:hypothetical protein